MKNWSDIIRWETHCDTIGDYFKNPYIIRILRSYYRVKNKDFLQQWEKLSTWISKSDKDKGFAPDFYSFVQDIFKSSDDLEDFLSFLRAEYYENTKKRDEILYRYNHEELVRLFLCFRETFNQISYDTFWQSYTQTMQGIFSTRISDILRRAFQDSFDEDDTINIHASLQQLFFRGFCPISESWEMLWYIWEGENGWVMVAPTTWWEDFEVFKDADVRDEITSRRWLIEKIRQVKRIRDCMCDNDWSVLSKEDIEYYNMLSEDYQLESLVTFREFLNELIWTLDNSLSKLPVSDTSIQKQLRDIGVLTDDGKPILWTVDDDWIVATKKVITWKPRLEKSNLKVLSSN